MTAAAMRASTRLHIYTVVLATQDSDRATIARPTRPIASSPNAPAPVQRGMVWPVGNGSPRHQNRLGQAAFLFVVSTPPGGQGVLNHQHLDVHPGSGTGPVSPAA